MRIGCLQFSPQVGDVDNNLNRADSVLSKANPQNLDLLVLPELAFSGYNFRSLQHISPYLEPTTSGITSLWARTTALKYDCVVVVGYPEKVDVSPKWPASPEYYNSAIVVNMDGETIANYRKSFLYYTDETWALEGPDGFFDGEIEGLGNTAMGICKWPTMSFERMDLNPYKFEAPWSAWEFAYHILHKEANLVILSMAWLTREDARSYSRQPKEPDMETLSYWLARLEPLIRAEIEGEIICVFANRTGVEEEAVYAGTSAVLGIHSGEVKVYGILGRGEKELLVVDTDKRPQAKLISEPNSLASNAQEEMAQAKKIKGDRSQSVKPEDQAKIKDESKPDREGTPTERIPVMDDTKSPHEKRSDGHPKREQSFERRQERKEPLPAKPDRTDLAPLNTTQPARPLSKLNERDTPLSAIPKTMEEVVTPLSPVDADSPHAYFSPIGYRPDPQNLLKSLRSSITHANIVAAKPDSPTFQRPASPKSRNASRNRNTDYTHREPALLTHDLAKEEQITNKAVFVPPPLNSAPSGGGVTHRSPTPTSPLGPRSAHSSPRPRSTVW